jgi:hypothetical protein
MLRALFSSLTRRSCIAALSRLPVAVAAGLQRPTPYPNKPSPWSPFPPGGLADLVARPVAEAMSRDLGQPVVIENKAGAGGGVGMAHAAKAPADGYTVLMSLSSLTVLPEADAVLGRARWPLNSLRRSRASPPIGRPRADAPEVGRICEDEKRPGAINYGRQLRHHARAHGNPVAKRPASDDISRSGAGPVIALMGGRSMPSSGPATCCA